MVENLHSFNKGMILLCQSILEMRRTSHYLRVSQLAYMKLIKEERNNTN